MMRCIYKYEIPTPGSTINHYIPRYAKFLTVRNQPEARQASMWFLVDPNEEKIFQTFTTLATGDTVKENMVYRGTYFLKDSTEVWHVFKVEDQ